MIQEGDRVILSGQGGAPKTAGPPDSSNRAPGIADRSQTTNRQAESRPRESASISSPSGQ